MISPIADLLMESFVDGFMVVLLAAYLFLFVYPLIVTAAIVVTPWNPALEGNYGSRTFVGMAHLVGQVIWVCILIVAALTAIGAILGFAGLI